MTKVTNNVPLRRLTDFRDSFLQHVDNLLRNLIFIANKLMAGIYRSPSLLPKSIIEGIGRYLADWGFLLRNILGLGGWNSWKLADSKWTIIFVGRKRALGEIIRLFYLENATITALGPVKFWSLPSQTRCWLEHDIDLVVCESSRIKLLRSQAPVCFSVPNRIDQKLDVSAPLHELLMGSRLNNIRHSIRAMQKEGYDYSVSSSKANFDNFYNNMYLPFVKARHGIHAAITPRAMFWRMWFKNGRGRLIVFSLDNVPKAASACYIAHDTCYCIEQGILDADANLIKKGAIALNYFGPIKWAKDQGAKYLNMGASSPWCSNGTFEYKHRWGPRVVRHQRHYAHWIFSANRLDTELEKRINQIGFICEDSGQLSVLSLQPDPYSLDQGEVAKLLDKANRNGMETVTVISSSPNKAANNDSRVLKKHVDHASVRK